LNESKQIRIKIILSFSPDDIYNKEILSFNSTDKRDIFSRENRELGILRPATGAQETASQAS
jgi:hypothetical protein